MPMLALLPTMRIYGKTRMTDNMNLLFRQNKTKKINPNVSGGKQTNRVARRPRINDEQFKDGDVRIQQCVHIAAVEKHTY